MTRRLLARLLGGWALATLVACVAVWSWSRIDPGPMPSHATGRWALAALDAARLGREPPAPPADAASFRATGPVVVIAWWRGRAIARHVGTESLVDTVEAASRAFASDEDVTGLAGWSLPEGDPQAVAHTVTVHRGEGPVWLGVPFVESLGVVPRKEGLRVTVDGRDAWITPEELLAQGFYDRGVETPLPDLSFGVPIDRLVDRLAREIGSEAADVRERGTVRRFRADTIAKGTWPRKVEVTEAALREAAVEGARFLLRHQRVDGSYTYIYSGRAGGPRPDAYNMPRHAGTTYFLAQVDRLHGMPEARAGARRALGWILRHHVRRCGSPESWCVEMHGHVEMGSSALAALAAAEYLAGGDDPEIRRMLDGLTAFMRSMQREDGEMMHEYDLRNDRPVDVQYLYYSGETAFALLRAHAVTGDERDLAVARKLMRHLTGAGWDFLGSRYYYGEEHWTCIAAAEASDRIEMPEALDFCGRWAAFNREVQYREGETPWPASGAYGVGPLVVPRLTPVASRTEAFISTHEMARRAGHDTTELRAQVERGLGMLLRWRWDPGPTHLFADPEGAHGGLPGSPVELEVRNDYVQHAASAMIRWADFLERERTRD